jgi:EF hand
LRERQELPALLAALDENADGGVSSDEIPIPIRIAVTLGPHVHELLNKPTRSVRSITPSQMIAAPPEWFVSMDKNNDLDLSPREFLGTTEQFRQFDSDGDGLLTVAEAQKLNAGQ